MHSTLIVAKMAGDDAPAVAKIFGESDATELPALLGVSERSLFRFHGLYFHLIQSATPLGARLEELRRQPLFDEVNQRLAEYVKPYSPSWRSPRDAMAELFYHWQSDDRPAGTSQDPTER